MKHDNNTFKDVIRAHSAGGEYVTQAQAAEIAGRTVRTIQRADLPSIKVGRERRYLRADLDAWLAKRHKAVKS